MATHFTNMKTALCSLSKMKKKFVLFVMMMMTISPITSQTKTITKAQYRDKTLAMILGSIGGALTGYEYLNVHNTPDGFYTSGATLKMPKEPILAMPDDWFVMLGGTLGGTTKDEHHYASWLRNGKMHSDDDQHIDFFNQYLLNKFGASISYEDIKNSWMHYEVSDFGGGQGAIEVMRDKDLMAPQCGHRDHGNSGHWLPECYIEHETMGAAFPGMPNKSAEFTERFSSITGEGEVVQWGYYWSAAHAIAFFETDVRTVVSKALGIMPANCRPRQMYDICVALHEKYPNNWRAAVRELWSEHWNAPFAVGHDKIMMLADVNNGTGFLSVLYGANDYMTTLRIVSLAGGDGDCTASAVCGLLGIVKGMSGTPSEFKDRIYNGGKGTWVNEVAHAFSIKKDFKIEWKYDEIVDMYQQNAEMFILAYGGVVTSTGYTIKTQSGTIPQIATNNWDFEKGTLEGWKTWTAGGTSSAWAERQCNETTKACFAGSGKYKGTVITSSNTAEAKLFQTVTGLKPGATYKLEGRTHTAAGREARFYVENYGGSYKYVSTYKGGSPFLYQYLYVTLGANSTSLDVGLHATATSNPGKWCSIDDLIIYEIENPSKVVRYEAEKALLSDAKATTSPTASGGSYVGWINTPNVSYVEFQNVIAAYAGEHIVRINYANSEAYSTQKVYVNGKYIGLIEHSDTGPWGAFSANASDAYVKLKKGPNTIRIVANTHFTEIDCIDLLSPYGSEGKPADGANLISGGIYKIVAKHSNKVLEVKDGNVSNGAFIVQNTYTGASTQYFQINKIKNRFYITPLHSTQSVEILGATTNNQDRVGLWGYWGGEGQQWAIIEAGDDYYKILNHKSGKAIDVAGGSKADGATVFQYDYLNGDHQKWRFDFVGTQTDDLPHFLPGKVEAEAFSAQFGTSTENTTDLGAGQNVRDIQRGEWLEYNVYVEKTGSYKISFRVASATAGGSLTLKSDATTLGVMSVSGTGGWQSWQTVQKDFNLTEGLHKLRLEFTGGTGVLFNLNWIEAAYNGVVTHIEEDEANAALYAIKVYPNPTPGKLMVEAETTPSKIDLINQVGQLQFSIEHGNTLDLSHLSKGIYWAKIYLEQQTKVIKIVKE